MVRHPADDSPDSAVDLQASTFTSPGPLKRCVPLCAPSCERRACTADSKSPILTLLQQQCKRYMCCARLQCCRQGCVFIVQVGAHPNTLLAWVWRVLRHGVAGSLCRR